MTEQPNMPGPGQPYLPQGGQPAPYGGEYAMPGYQPPSGYPAPPAYQAQPGYSPPPPAAAPPVFAAASSKMSPHKMGAFVAGGLFAVLAVVGFAFGGGTGKTPVVSPIAALETNSSTTSSLTDPDAIDKLQLCMEITAGTRAYDPAQWDTALCGEYQGGLPAAEPTASASASAASELTVAQQNAVEKAASYLEFSAFSRSGLIKQLKFEGFSTKDATIGVDAQKADWNEQAVKKAQSYLDFSSFSRAGLIKQLKYEGFTTKQANYGVKKVGL